MNGALIIAAISFLVMGFAIAGLGIYLNSRQRKVSSNELPDRAMNTRKILDVRTAFYVNGVPNADVEFDGLHIHITLPAEYEKKAPLRARIEHMAAQVFRQGIPIIYGFDDRVLYHGITLRDTSKKAA